MRRSIKELQSGGFAVVMKLKCELEVVYSLAVASGGAGNRSHRARASLSLGKKLGSNASGGRSWEEIFLIVSTVKNVSGTKYKIKNNVVKIFCKFLQEGKATIKFKEPAHDLSISKVCVCLSS